MAFFVTLFALAGSRLSVIGGPYANVEPALGPFGGFLAAVSRTGPWRRPYRFIRTFGRGLLPLFVNAPVDVARLKERNITLQK